jgi:hypothetical protein
MSNAGNRQRIQRKKMKKQLDILKSVRKTWGFDPTSRVVRDRTKYTRRVKHKTKVFFDASP